MTFLTFAIWKLKTKTQTQFYIVGALKLKIDVR